MTEVTPNLKPYVTCGCDHPDCPREGPPRRKAWSNGQLCVRRCPCRRCVGSRQRAKARRREHKVAKAVGGQREVLSGALSGTDVAHGVCDVEETANQAITRGIKRWWTSKGVTTKVARLMERRIRPRALVLAWDRRHRVVVMPYEDFVELCQMAVAVRDEEAS